MKPTNRPANRRPPQRRRKVVETPPAGGWASRLAAAELLLKVELGADLDTALAEVPSYTRLTGADRGFARAIASAALRALGRIDYALGGLIDRPLDQIEPPVKALLRVGCAQLWLMGVAAHAGVSETVEAARQWPPARKGGGLVNAVLRRATREIDLFANAPPTTVWPDWIAARLKAAVGEAGADAMASLQIEEPSIDLSLKPGESPQAWADRLGGEELANGSVRLRAGVPLTDLMGYAEGQWWVQDAAAAIPARLMGDIANRSVADLCAAPGGKTLQLAAMGANVTALDISRQRLSILRENAARTQLSIEVVEADAREWRPAAPFDAVLLDAPCSALGVLRRHPEGAWRRDPAGLARFPTIQSALLASAHAMLKPGGRLIYCVCTPTPEEGRDIIAAAIASGAWRRVPVDASEIAGFSHSLTIDGDVLTAPPIPVVATGVAATEHMPGENVAEPVLSDVFFVARLESVG